jgi:predicted ATPase/transcriptional regulator with XRE-family HTH domain
VKATVSDIPTFGALLRHHRLAASLSQEALGVRAGLSASAIAALERGRRRAPRPATVLLLAEALGLLAPQRATLIGAASVARVTISENIKFAAPWLPPSTALSRRTRTHRKSIGEGARHHRHNLPVPATHIFGREQDVHTGCMLLRGDARMVTLTGPGGIGKTRVALETAAALVDDFADGVWFVDLAPLTDAELLLATVARALGVHDDTTEARESALLRVLHDRELLLVLDNCEHLVDACSQLVERLLNEAQHVRVLATSRVPIRAKGEVSRPVGPLTLPPQASAPSVDQLQHYASVRLLVDRAIAVEPSFVVTDQNAWAVVEICRRLDGIPLALELAAARMNALSPEQIVSRLDDRLRLLTRGSRTALPRHQTLRATLDWSYELLPERDRRVFERLAVFAGNWTLQAAEAIAAGDGLEPADILDSLAALIDQSLVTVERGTGEHRYRLLETVRQYAWEHLLGRHGASGIHRRHLEWYLGLAERSNPERHGTRQQPGFVQVAAEYDNLRIALAWSLEHDRERAVRLAGCLADFWRRGGYHAEGRRWLNETLAIADASDAPAEAYARVLLGAGLLAGDDGDFGPDQIMRAEASVRLFREAGGQRGLNYALIHLGRCILASGGPLSRVQELFDESLRVARAAEYEHGIGFSLANLAQLQWSQGKHQPAVEQCLESIEHVRASGDALFTGLLLGWAGWLAMVEGDLEAARRYKEESLAILRRLEAREAVGLALLGLAYVAHRIRDHPRLHSLLQESASLLRESGSPGLSDWFTFAGRLLVERGEYETGVQLLAAGECEGPRFGSLRFILYQPASDAVDASLAIARSALSDVPFRAAWNDGKAMTVPQAVAVGLAGAEILT